MVVKKVSMYSFDNPKCEHTSATIGWATLLMQFEVSVLMMVCKVLAWFVISVMSFLSTATHAADWPYLPSIISFGILFLLSILGIILELNNILFTILKLASRRRIALNFETDIVLLCFSSIIEIPFCHRS